MIDEINAKILNIIQENARVANAEIARRLGMAPSAILERIRKLEALGIIEGYEARVNPAALGLDLLAFVFVRTNERLTDTDTANQIAAIPEVQEVHHVAGEDCYLVKVRARDPHTLGALLREKFGAIPSIISTRTTVVLQTVKETATLPLPSTPETGEEPFDA
jgi:Lrp/AsnC family leucine-responsive transcriptional regulator